MKRIIVMVVAISSVATLVGLGLVGRAWRASELDDMVLQAGPDRAAIERTAREIEAFNQEVRRHQAAVDRRASWYGVAFHGKQTASGKPYDRWGLTCANRDLPLWTPVKLTNLANRRSVIVLVNDRGPYHKNRFGRYDRDFDLSEWAAYQLGIREQGLACVEVCVLEGR